MKNLNFNKIGTYTLIQRENQRFLRTSVQTLISPWINALLYIFIFGYVVGYRINFHSHASYIEFVLPGILLLNLITASFSQSSFSIFHQKYFRHIEEILIAPLSSFEIISGYVVGAVFRSIVVGIGIYLIAIFFNAASVDHVILFLTYSILVSLVFAFLGLVVGLWADSFEKLNVFRHLYSLL